MIDPNHLIRFLKLITDTIKSDFRCKRHLKLNYNIENRIENLLNHYKAKNQYTSLHIIEQEKTDLGVDIVLFYNDVRVNEHKKTSTFHIPTLKWSREYKLKKLF